MKLSGHLTLEIVNELTGEIVQTIEQDNIITNYAYASTQMTSLCYWNGRNIFISPETATPVRSKTNIQCLGVAYRGTGQPDIQCYHNANPPYFVITQRLDSVGTARVFQTIGLTDNGGPQVAGAGFTVNPWAYLLLNSPCTQELNQILNLTYRITVQSSSSPNTSKPLFPRWINDVCYNLVFQNGITNYQDRLFNMAACAPLRSYGWKYLYVTNTLSSMNMEGNSNNGYRSIAGPIGSSENTLFYRYRQYWDYYRSDASGVQGANGRVINGVLSGWNVDYKTQAMEADPGFTYSAHTSYNITSGKNLQSAFAYTSPQINIGPMFLSANTPSGTGAVSFSEDPWTGSWPAIYRVKITDSGNVGTAKFVVGVKFFTSFYSDGSYTYNDSTKAFHPYVVSVIQPYTGCHGWQLTMPILAWDNNWTVQADSTGLSIINQFTGQHYDFDATTSPALPITSFRQMAFDKANNFIYVACANTGLWKLNIANKASVVITHVSTTPAYAVDVNASGVVYTYMNLTGSIITLTSSASSYTTDLISGASGFTTSDRIYIYVNKLHADTRIAIVVRNGWNDGQGLNGASVYWWSLANGNEGTTYGNVPYCGESQCSFAWVNGSSSRMWSGVGILLNWASNVPVNGTNPQFNPVGFNYIPPKYDPETARLLNGNLNTTNQMLNANVAQDPWGSLLGINYQAQRYSPGNGAGYGTYNRNQNYQLKRVALPNGIILDDLAHAHMFDGGMDNYIARWFWYKWDGTNWVSAVDHASDTDTFTDTTGTSTRTTSTSYLNLLDGINIKFQNGASGTSFIAGEVYDQYVCKGILKTNDTYVYVENSPIYTQPLYEKITLTPTVITAPNNYGVVVDGAPGNTSVSAAVSATAVDPLFHSLIPQYDNNNIMGLYIDGAPITAIYAETVSTIPDPTTLTAGQVNVYRSGLILCSSADVGKTLSGFFSYVARSD